MSKVAGDGWSRMDEMDRAAGFGWQVRARLARWRRTARRAEGGIGGLWHTGVACREGKRGKEVGGQAYEGDLEGR